MKLLVTLATAEPEAAFNALRLALFARQQGDEVTVFLIGKGVELDQITAEPFAAKAQAEALLAAGGSIQACGTCLRLRPSTHSGSTISTVPRSMSSAATAPSHSPSPRAVAIR